MVTVIQTQPLQNYDSSLFELVGISDRIDLNNVYGNGLHSLQQLEISNLTNEPVVVKLQSTLKDQLNFQLYNENMENILNKRRLATNTVEWSQHTQNEHCEFNQLFNYVNYIDTIELKPEQSLPFILAFLPWQETDDTIYDGDDGADLCSEDSNNSDHGLSNMFSNVAGKITLTGFYKNNPLMISKRVYKFKADICEPFLTADDVETGLVFEDVLVGETYMKDIVIRNQSAIELFWKLNVADLSSTDRGDWLQFIDASNFQLIDNVMVIGPFSQFILRAVFTPKEAGKFDYDLQIENTNDTRNIIQTRIHATSRTFFLHKETLIVSSGNILDFGDCIAGSWNKQQISLLNKGDSPIEIHFRADGAELGFDIKQKPEEEFTRSSTPQIPPGHSGQKTPESDQSSSESPRPSSPSSHRTNSTTTFEEHTSSSDSYTSTDMDIDMLAAYNEVYSAAISNNSVFAKHTDTPEESYTKIEDMIIKPGMERVIQVSYRPSKDDESGVHAGQLTKCGFRIILEYKQYKSADPTEHKIIQCKASYCTSFVKVLPQAIDFGHTDVGTQKSQAVKIVNRSDIVARVELNFESKVLNCTQQGELLIQPRGSIELRLDIYPRKVNTSYKRQITLINYLNRDNDQIIEVSSTNIDKNRITFHSLFYRILTPTGANFLDFGPIALNSPAIRTCTLENIRNAPLLLEISTLLHDEVVIYTKKKSSQKKRTSIIPSPVMDKHEPNDVSPTSNTSLTNNHVTHMTNADYFSTAYLDLATVPRLRFSTIRNKRIARTQAGRSVLIKELKSSDMQRQNTKLDKNEDIILSDACSNIKSVSTPTIARATLSSSSNVAMPSPIYVEPNSLYSSTTSTPTEEKPGNNINSNVRSLSGNKGLSEKHKPKSQLTHIKKQQVSHKTIKNLKQSLGITGTHTKLRKSMDWSDIAGKSRVPFDDLVTILEQGSRSRTPLFPNQSLEEQFVRYQLAWRTELQRLIEKSEIVKTTFLELEPMGEEDLIIVYTPKKDTNTHIQSAPKNQNAWIAFRLLDFDRTAIDASEFETLLGFNRSFIPVRKVILRAQLCRSSMDLGQKNINFGVVDRNERHHKTIILHNRTETPLLYTIKKSGSIASGDIKFGMGRHGVVRGFGKREIEFLFEPTLPGSFMEHLEVINIRDKEDTNVISLKANIRRPVLFSIRLTELSFGPCILGKVCDRIETVIITNTNKQSRLFEVRLDPDDAANTTLLSVYNVKVDYTIDEQSEAMNMPLSKEEEEEIENLEQKLKIARRKGQPDKIKKYQKKLARLKKISNDEEEEENSTENTKGDYQAGSREHEIEVEEKKDTNQVVKTASTFTYKKEEGRIIFSLGSNATKKISVHFTVTSKKSIQGDDSTFSIATGRILVNEHRNIDSYKSVMFSTTICHDDASFLQQKKLFEQHPSDPL